LQFTVGPNVAAEVNHAPVYIYIDVTSIDPRVSVERDLHPLRDTGINRPLLRGTRCSRAPERREQRETAP
jgi:hypothetical protein